MLYGIVESEELASNKGLPSLLMMVIVSPKSKVNDIDDCSFYNDPANDISNHNLDTCRQLSAHKVHNKQHYLNQANHQKVVDVYFVIVLSVLDSEEGPLDDEVDHVADIDQDEQDDLDDWVYEGYGKQDCC